MKTNYEYYLDYLNNFLTIEAFADYYHMSVSTAQSIVDYGRNDAYEGNY